MPSPLTRHTGESVKREEITTSFTFPFNDVLIFESKSCFSSASFLADSFSSSVKRSKSPWLTDLN